MLVKNKDKRCSSDQLIFEIQKIDKLNEEEIISDKVSYTFINNWINFDLKSYLKDFYEEKNLNNNLLKREENFLGRKEIFQQIDYLFNEVKVKIIEIYGDSGTGKSSVALEYAYRFLENNNSAYWLKSDKDNLEIEFEKLATILELKIQIRIEKTIESLKKRLNYFSRKVLLIFDNCDNFLLADSLAKLVFQKNIHIIITNKRNNSNFSLLTHHLELRSK